MKHPILYTLLFYSFTILYGLFMEDVGSPISYGTPLYYYFLITGDMIVFLLVAYIIIADVGCYFAWKERRSAVSSASG